MVSGGHGEWLGGRQGTGPGDGGAQAIASQVRLVAGRGPVELTERLGVLLWGN